MLAIDSQLLLPCVVSDDVLRNQNHTGHLPAAALKRHKDKPVLFLGDTTLTGGRLADRMSQYIRAFEVLGAGTGATVAVLSLNRPEVLMMAGASQTREKRTDDDKCRFPNRVSSGEPLT